MWYFSLDDLDYAIFESNGKLSALENPNKENHSTSIPLTVIDNGKIEKNNALILGLTNQKIMEFLSKNNLSLNKTEILTVDDNGRVYLKQKGQKYQILSLSVGGNDD